MEALILATLTDKKHPKFNFKCNFSDTEQMKNISFPKIDFKYHFSETEQMRRIFSNVKETILSIYLDSIGMGDW